MYSFTFLAGLLLLVIGIFVFKERIDFLKKGHVATATVIELKEYKDEGSYTPVFRFMTPNKEEIIHVHNVSTNLPSWSIGDEAKVVYDKNHPHKVVVLTYVSSFMTIIVLFSFALIFLCISGANFWSKRFFNSLA